VLYNEPMDASLGPLLRELKAGLTALYGERLARVVLFGSQARGDATEDSDVDVLVVLRGPFSLPDEMERTSYLTAELSLKYDTLISRLVIPEARLSENSPLLINIRREGVPL